jgi:hypothetical protein
MNRRAAPQDHPPGVNEVNSFGGEVNAVPDPGFAEKLLEHAPTLAGDRGRRAGNANAARRDRARIGSSSNLRGVG